jgi:hypothetical protein
MSADKGVMMRDFHLYIHADGTLWKQLVKKITNRWLKPVSLLFDCRHPMKAYLFRFGCRNYHCCSGFITKLN